jgi:uncharacterized glyoxalase superfamily protein PhnB
MAKPIPDRYHSVTPHLVVRDAAHAIGFYADALGAETLFHMPGPDGTSVLHAELKLGDSVLLLGEESIEDEYLSPLSLGGTPVSLMIYCEDTDAAFARAVAAGCRSLRDPRDMFWGDRFAQVRDPFGHVWSFATHVRDVSQAEIRAALRAMSSEGK